MADSLPGRVVLRGRKIVAAVLRYPPVSDYVDLDRAVAGTPSAVAEEGGDPGVISFGVQVEILRRAMRREGVEVIFRPVRLDHLESVFEAPIGADCMFPIFPSPDRNETGVVVGKTHRVGLSAIARREHGGIKTEQELLDRKRRIVVTTGEIGHEYLRGKIKEGLVDEGQVSELKAQSLTDMMILVREKIVDVAICDSLTCYRFLKMAPEGNQLIGLFLGDPIDEFEAGFFTPRNDDEFGLWLDRSVLVELAESWVADYERREFGGVEGVIRRVLG
ncbi:MAG: transporter substrate-binding domain-containing protein [Planctomycetota bacterium]